MDAESVGLAEALKHENVELRTGVTVERLELDDGARRCADDLRGPIEADQVVLAAGAVHTPVLLLGRRRRPVRAASRTGPTRSGATS
jgi:phytoene dehydrogenase-like protein